MAVRVWFPVPETGLIDSQVASSDTDHESVPHPVFEMAKVVVLVLLVTLCKAGVTESTGVPLPAWTTVTVLGLPVAPVAVMVMVAVLVEQVVLAVKVAVIV